MKSLTLQPVHKYFIKSFLATGVPFAIMMALFDIYKGHPFSLDQFLFMMIFFGLFMGWFFTNNQISGLKRLGVKEFTDKHFEMIQKLEVQSRDSLKKIYKKLMQNYQFSKSKISIDKDLIKIRKGTSWSSWGELIQIRKIDESENLNTYQISSQPILKIAYADGGKNFENIHIIKDILTG